MCVTSTNGVAMPLGGLGCTEKEGKKLLLTDSKVAFISSFVVFISDSGIVLFCVSTCSSEAWQPFT